MDIDLYKDDFTAMTDADFFRAVELFTRIAAAPGDRMQEGYLVDFKAKWSDSALKTVAGFANTFGGLLLIGVGENGGRADGIVGVRSSRHELKTTIASAIASNISPTPPYDIRDVAFPSDPANHLCIIRVRKGSSLYLLTKKGEQPVYVRNENETIPADAARLQSLLAARAITGHTRVELTAIQPPTGPGGFYVNELFTEGNPGQKRRSETFFEVDFTPEEPLFIPLDLTIEDKLIEIIEAIYPEVSRASLAEVRSRNWYQLTYRDEPSDYEMSWALSEAGEVHFVTQVRRKVQDAVGDTFVWSLCDMVTNLDWAIEIAHRLWDYFEYPGEGRLASVLQIAELTLLERGSFPNAVFASAFYCKNGLRKRAKPLPVSALTKSQLPGHRAFGGYQLTYAGRHSSRADVAAIVVNQLLRDLGHSAKRGDLRSLL